MDNGSINFKLLLDDTEARRQADTFRQKLRSIGADATVASAQMDGAFRQLAQTLALTFGTGAIISFGRSVIQVRAEMQGLEASFTSLLQSGSKAKTLLAELTKFGAETPTELADLAKASQTLLSFGVSGEKIMPIIKQLGDISGGSGEKMQGLALAFAQMSSSGKLMGQDLLQMINQGFNPLQEISRTTGRSMKELKEAMSQGAISVDMVAEAFRTATEEGGLFYKNLEGQSATLRGQLGQLSDAYTQMLNKIGESSEGVISAGISAVTSLINHYETIGKILLTLVATYGAYKAAVIAVAAVQKVLAIRSEVAAFISLAKSITGAKDAMLLFNVATASNPIGAILAVVTATATALYLFSDSADKATVAQKAMADVEKTTSEEMAKQKAQINSLQRQIHDNTLSIEARTSAIKKLQEIEPNYNATISEEGRIIRENTQAIDEYLERLQKQIRLKAVEDKLVELERQKIEHEEEVRKARDEARAYAKRATSAAYGGMYSSNIGASGAGLLAESRQNKLQRKIKETNEALDELSRQQAELTQQLQAPTKSEGRTLAQEIDENNKALSEALDKRRKILREKNATTEDGRNPSEVIEELDKQIKGYRDKLNTLTGRSSAGGSKPNANHEIVERKQQAIELRQAQERLEREQQELLIKQQEERIATMQDGWKKEEAVLALNAEKRKQAYKRVERDLVDALREERRKQWEIDNPKAKDQGKVFDPARVTAADLSQSSKALLQEQQRILNEQELQEHKEHLEKLIDGYETYEQQVERLRKEYAKRREALYQHDASGNRQGYKSGVTKSNEDEVNLKEREAIERISVEFAQREEAFKAWMDQVAYMSLDQLSEALKQAELELSKAKLTIGADPQQLAIAQAKVATLRSSLAKVSAQDGVAPGRRAVKEWKDLADMLDKSAKSFDELGSAIGGTAGKLISGIGGITSSTFSAINSIVQLTQASAAGMTTAGQTASKSVQMVEKASVVLAVITTAIQVAQKIASLFNSDETKDKEIQRLQKRIDALQWIIDNQGAIEIDKYANSFERARVELRRAEESVGRFNGSLSKANEVSAYILRHQEAVRASAERLAKVYESISYSAGKAIGGQKYSQARDQMKAMSEQQLALAQQINAEGSKKKSDPSKIDEYKRKIAELGAKQAEVVNKLTEEVLGGDFAKLSNELGDAIASAFEKGEDAAEAFNAKVSDIMRNIVKAQLTEQLLKKPILDAFDKYKQRFKDVGFDPSKIRELIPDLAKDFKQIGDRYVPAYTEALNTLKKQMGDVLGTGEGAREASKKGIATASQESVDENNGLLRSMQGLTAEIQADVHRLRSIAGEQLLRLAGIESNTSHLIGMREDLRSMQQSLSDIQTRGVKIQ
nr:MAG TPA: tail tape measure protein [Caudoviricetes sp.]